MLMKGAPQSATETVAFRPRLAGRDLHQAIARMADDLIKRNYYLPTIRQRTGLARHHFPHIKRRH